MRVQLGQRSQALCQNVFVLPPAAALCTGFPFIVKQRAHQEDLNGRHHRHDDEVHHRPEVDSVKVTLLQVTVTRLERPQQRLDLDAFSQSTLYIVDGVLRKMKSTSYSSESKKGLQRATTRTSGKSRVCSVFKQRCSFSLSNFLLSCRTHLLFF